MLERGFWTALSEHEAECVLCHFLKRIIAEHQTGEIERTRTFYAVVVSAAGVAWK